MHHNTNSFIEDLLARDEQAYEILLDMYEVPIFRFFYYSHGNHNTAQDQCGETFARFVVSVKNFNANNPDRLRAFIFGIARNVLLQSYRSKKVIQEGDYSLEKIPSNKPSVFQEVSSREELVFALDAIRKFKDPERQILLLRFVEDLKLNEIANILNMPINSVKSHIHRGRKKLCELLSGNKLSDQEITNHGK